MDSSRLFHKDRQGRRDGGVALYVKRNGEYIEISYDSCGNPIK